MNEVIDRDLIALPLPQDALGVFTTPGAIEPYLQRVRDAIDAFESDATTDAGRKAIKSMAFKVAKAKTALEAEGKRLADEQKKIPKLIDATRKQINDTLDAWRDEVRKPVDDWEAAEQARVDAIKSNLAELQGAIDDQIERTSEVLRDRLGEVERDEYSEARFGDYLGAAIELKAEAIKRLTARIAAAEKREADAAELEKLRAEKAARDALDREADIRAQAADEERRRNEAAAQAERDAFARREAELQAERDAAEERAKQAAQKAVDDQRAKQAAEAAEAAKREKNRQHCAAINNAAVDALVAAGIDKVVAKQVVVLIAKRAVPAVSISY